jgi:hypothetical protein
VRASSIVIEEIAEGARPELIEVAAADPVSLIAVSGLRGSDVVGFVAPRESQGPASSSLDRPPTMVVAVGDARVAGCARTLVGLRKRGVLSVAIVAVDSLGSLAEVDTLTRVFDAVLPVVVAHAVDAEAPLAGAVAAVTAFATADCISLPVDEVYPFFAPGGHLTCGAADADDVVAAVAIALAAARLGKGSRVVRMLLHIETTQQDLLRDLDLASQAVHRAVQLDEVWPTASVSRGTRKGISLVAATKSIGDGRGGL